MTKMLGLKIRGVSRRFGSVPLLRSVSVDLCPGTITVLMGRNGSGKTTLINCVTGFDQNYEGEVFLGNELLNGTAANERAQRGIVRTFQYPHLFANMTVARHIALARYASMHAIFSYIYFDWETQIEEQVLASLKISDLSAKTATQLSFGEMKLVNIARALGTGANIFLFDEPLASLHGERREAVLTTLAGLRDSGSAILVVEHDICGLLNMADSVYELVDGILQKADHK
jgi:branched-chain amino acid transport system ATP-binding protein